MSIRDALHEHPFLSGLPAPQLAMLEPWARLVTFKPGEYLLREGQRASLLFLLVSGAVSLEFHAPGKGAVQLETLRTGDILGLSWLKEVAAWNLDAKARTEVRAVAIDAVALKTAMDADPAFGYAMAQRMLLQVLPRLERVRVQHVAFEEAHAWMP